MANPQSSSAPSPGAQPKIVQRLLVRTAGFLIVLAILFGAFRWVQAQQGDFDRGGDSVGMIAAIRMERDGQQMVLIHPDGTIVGTKSWTAGNTDREPTWSPDGRFLFFCSDRKDKTFNVFRWNPTSDDAHARTEGGTSRSNPTFAPGDPTETPLIVSGGFVRELDPKNGHTPQILPPINAEIAQGGAGDESGTEGSFGALYGTLGKSFRVARYLPNKRYIVAVMRRDEGEVLVVQDLQPMNDRVPRPKPVAAGDRVDFDIDPKSGEVAYSVQNFQWPDKDAAPAEFRQGNRLTVPFRNMVGLIDPAAGKQEIVGASGDDAHAFGSPRVSPDGTRLLLVAGRVEDGSLRPAALLTMPLARGGIGQASALVQGDVYEPSWSIDAKRVAYAKRTGGKRDLFTMASDGTDEKNLTKGQGDFASPLFSPMTK